MPSHRQATLNFTSGIVPARSLAESCFVRCLLFAYLCLSLGLISSGCTKRQHATITRDACSLVSKQEVELVQQASVNDAKSSERSDGTFRISQCLYSSAEFSKSVNLALIQTDPGQAGNRSPKDFWEEKFGAYQQSENERGHKAETKNEEEEKGPPPKKITGLGDEAFWVSNRFGGILYILKGNTFISIGIGGTDDEETKLEKSKLLAQKALQRL
jgi:hypothetical protein